MKKENPHFNDGLIIEAVAQAGSRLGERLRKHSSPRCGGGYKHL